MLLTVEKFIDYGGFSRVYVARVIESSSPELVGKQVALKKLHTTKHVKNPVLRHEACALIHLQGHPSIPKIYGWGTSQYYEYLALQLLGAEIDSVLANDTGNPSLTMLNLVALVCQMIDAVHHIHSHHLIHGDIKPGNFLLAPRDSEGEGRILIIDFGLTTSFRDPDALRHFDDLPTKSLRGTSLYASLNMHLHRVRPSSPNVTKFHNASCPAALRRDDMESLAYTIIKLLRGSLPWKDERIDSIFVVKQQWSGAALCAGYPPVFGEFVKYARPMEFEQEPVYGFWKKRLCELAPNLGDDALYDFTDTQGPFVGVPHCVALDSSRDGAIREQEPSEDDSDSIPSSDNCWIPTSTWPGPSSIRNRVLIGNESVTVAALSERIVAPPSMKNYLYSRLPEVMLP